MGQLTIPFVKGSGTSFQAAESIRPFIEKDEDRILEFIASRREYGATCDEIEKHLGLSHQTSSARLAGLKKKFKIKDSGKTRLTRSNRAASVMVII